MFIRIDEIEILRLFYFIEISFISISIILTYKDKLANII